jgi:putative MATE family efflux protein
MPFPMRPAVATKPRSDILEGSLTRPVLRLMWPLFTGYVFQASFNIVDMYWVGRLGADALAAVGSCAFMVWMMIALSEMVGVGALSHASRHLGAGRGEEAGRVLGSSLVAAMVIAGVIGVVGVSLAGWIFRLTGTEESVAVLGTSYLTILFQGLPFLFLFFVMESLFRAGGNTSIPMTVLIANFILNMVLDPFLIFGWGPFPEMGVAGAALATVLSRFVGAAVLGIVLWRVARNLGYQRPPSSTVSVPVMLRLLRVGVPAALAGAGFAIIYLFVVRVQAIFGTIAVAALVVGLRTEGIFYYVNASFGRAAATMVGQNLGAGQPERAAAAPVRAILLAEIGMATATVVFLTLAPQLVGIFIDDPEVIRAGSHFLRIISWAMLFLAVEIVLFQTAAGAGDTIPAMLIVVPGTALRVPLGYFLGVTLGMGYQGVFWAIALTVVLKATLFVVWFRLGRWKEKAL